MSFIEHSSLVREQIIPWQQYLFDSALAIFGVLGMTGVMFFCHLYPRIPNISMVYLLVILPLATTRGRYSATFAAVLAFLAFDFFLVPPIYTFTIYNPDEWVALGIFLIDALLIGHLAAALRQRAEESSRRERETRALYHLWRTTSREEKPTSQLQAISRAIVEVFAPWGVQECNLLTFDQAGVVQVQSSASLQPPTTSLSSAEQSCATDVRIAHPTLRVSLFARIKHVMRLTPTDTTHPLDRSVHLLSLKLGQKTVGALRLYVQGDPRPLLQEEHLEDEGVFAESSSFFSTFLNQVAALLERVHLQQENLRMEVLQRTDVLRAALLSSVSHDLRTPLTSIKAAASSLLQHDVQWDEEARCGFLRAIEQEADRLNRLVANLLDMSRIEEGALKPDKDWYSLKALIQDVLGRMAPLFEKRTVQLRLPDDLLLIELDYLQIDQVLTNVLENALRYTPNGSPLEISACCKDAQVVLRVADRGPGIPPADLERVFDKFYRVLHDTANSGQHRGSGLGLAVCKGLVEAHGGHIWAEQREGGGLIVSIILPVSEEERMFV
jgi:two-component system, OmpR family, sensor histidine kinase KdpD